jgi:hypothetical protein
MDSVAKAVKPAATGCSTFGRLDFMRVPWPAARMTTARGRRTRLAVAGAETRARAARDTAPADFAFRFALLGRFTRTRSI